MKIKVSPQLKTQLKDYETQELLHLKWLYTIYMNNRRENSKENHREWLQKNLIVEIQTWAT